MKRMIVSLNSGNPEQRNEITKYFENNALEFWHWIDDTWLIIVNDNITPKILHESIEARTNVGTPTMLVFEFNGDITFWGRNKPEAWQWLSKFGSSG